MMNGAGFTTAMPATANRTLACSRSRNAHDLISAPETNDLQREGGLAQ
jgi:hypothetical protein